MTEPKSHGHPRCQDNYDRLRGEVSTLRRRIAALEAPAARPSGLDFWAWEQLAAKYQDDVHNVRGTLARALMTAIEMLRESESKERNA